MRRTLRYCLLGLVFGLPLGLSAQVVQEAFGTVKKAGNFLVHIIDAFDDIDTAYVERNRYNFTLMGQTTSNLEWYQLGTSDYSNGMSFAQHPDLRFGPFFGWRWLFFGWSFDVGNKGGRKSQGTRFELSLYTSMIGVDLIYRRTGSDFYLQKVKGLGDDAKKYEGSDCDYLSTSVTGVNLYYVLNHRRFSNPAVYSQSTIQRRSAGSWLFGASVTSHDINFDYSKLPKELFAETEVENRFASLERIKYTDFSLSAGYAYNWVPARNWCFGITASPAIGYKRASTKTVILEDEETGKTYGNSFMNRMDELFRHRGNLNFNLTGRIGGIFNNGRWFAGLFGVIHTFNYRAGDIRFSNSFGTVNLCGGFYFQQKKEKDN